MNKEELFRNKLIIDSPTSISIGHTTWFTLDTKLVGRVKALLNENEEKGKEIKRLKQSIVILENYLELIHDLGYDYDGLKYEYELKGLIDEMVRFASLGRAYNTTEEIYVDGKGKSFNILGEELKENK